MFQIKNQKGQSLIETMVAIGVIVTGLVGALTLVNFTIKSTTTTVNRLVGQNLAWEGIEVVLNMRDSNFLKGNAFDDGIIGADSTAIAVFDENTNTWELDFTPNVFSDITTTLIQQGGVYRQSTLAISGQPTNYKRIITISTPGVGSVLVSSEVQWVERGSAKSVSAERVLWDWR